jgi:hypothetical protein
MNSTRCPTQGIGGPLPGGLGGAAGWLWLRNNCTAIPPDTIPAVKITTAAAMAFPGIKISLPVP